MLYSQSSLENSTAAPAIEARKNNIAMSFIMLKESQVIVTLTANNYILPQNTFKLKWIINDNHSVFSDLK